MTLSGIFNMAVFFFPPHATVAIIASEVLRQFAYGTSGPLIWAMMGDVADYGEWKTGRRATGTVTAAVVFALWVGLALGGAIAGWLFSFYGYVANAVQTSACPGWHSPDGGPLFGAVVLRDRSLPVLLSHFAQDQQERFPMSWRGGV